MVAPLTVLMCAFCAVSTSWRSCGTAPELICWEWRSWGRARVVTSTILPADAFTWTCTGPYPSLTTVPLTVVVPDPSAGVGEPVPGRAPGTAGVTMPGDAPPVVGPAVPEVLVR